MMKISKSQKRLLLLKILHNEHTDYLVSSFDEGMTAKNHSLQRLDCIVLLIVKLYRGLKNLQLDINAAKIGQFHVFPRQAANSAAKGEFRGMA